MSRTSWNDARAIAGSAAPLPAELRALTQCAGLIAAADVRAPVALPPVVTSAMDGFAVAGPPPWTVRGLVLAGQVWSTPLSTGDAVEIATGAPVPAGADAVVPYEQSQRTVQGVLSGESRPAQHMRPIGSDCSAGELLLPAGLLLGPFALGLAASAGHDELPVQPRPSVAAVVTGTELLAHGLPGDGYVRDALGPLLPGLVDGLGGELAASAAIADDRELLAASLRRSVDVHVVTGASSVGPADHLHKVLADAGARVLVDGVACRPGHPQLLATLPDGGWIVGLPGNPFAAVVAAMTLLAPLLGALAGRPPAALTRARLAGDVRPRAGLTRLVPVRLAAHGVAVPVGPLTASSLRGAALASHLAVLSAADTDVGLLPLPQHRA